MESVQRLGVLLDEIAISNQRRPLCHGLNSATPNPPRRKLICASNMTPSFVVAFNVCGMLTTKRVIMTKGGRRESSNARTEEGSVLQTSQGTQREERGNEGDRVRKNEP